MGLQWSRRLDMHIERVTGKNRFFYLRIIIPVSCAFWKVSSESIQNFKMYIYWNSSQNLPPRNQRKTKHTGAACILDTFNESDERSKEIFKNTNWNKNYVFGFFQI